MVGKIKHVSLDLPALQLILEMKLIETGWNRKMAWNLIILRLSYTSTLGCPIGSIARFMMRWN
jgi:hypothetical protein